MNGYEIYKKAVSLIGFNNHQGSVQNDAGMGRKALDSLSTICADLEIALPQNLSQQVSDDEEICNACVWGVAMLLSLGLGNPQANRLFCDLYNSKRSFVKSKLAKISDVLPKDDGGYDI